MVTAKDVPRILSDAARLVAAGEIVVFGSASLALWLDDAPASKDVDVWVTPEDRGELVEALMGELSWYHDKHDAYVEVCGPETFEAPASWRMRAKTLIMPGYERVQIVAPHPHDVLVAELPRLSPSDRDHIRRILAELPIERDALESLANQAPSRAPGADSTMREAFDQHLESALRV